MNSHIKFSRRNALIAGATLPAVSLFSSHVLAAAGAIEHKVSINALPTSIETFIQLRDANSTTPQGAAATFAVASILYSMDVKLGLQALTTVIEGKWLTDGTNGYKGKQPSKIDQQRFLERWSKSKGMDYVPRSYVQGTSPKNGYTIPAGPLLIQVREQTTSKESDTSYKMFVHSTGASSPRPVKLLKNDKGIFKASEWSSLTSGVAKPETATSDDI